MSPRPFFFSLSFFAGVAVGLTSILALLIVALLTIE
jgi:hypothetical protein